MPQNNEVRGVATNIRTDKEGTHVRYHNTDVVSFDADAITLRTGGWQTATTKLRMNQASNQFGLRYHVYAKKGCWFIDTGYSMIPFCAETMVFQRSPYAGDVAANA